MIDWYCHERSFFLAKHKVKQKMQLGTKITRKGVTSSLLVLVLMCRKNVGNSQERLALGRQDSSFLQLSMDSKRK